MQLRLFAISAYAWFKSSQFKQALLQNCVCWNYFSNLCFHMMLYVQLGILVTSDFAVVFHCFHLENLIVSITYSNPPSCQCHFLRHFVISLTIATASYVLLQLLSLGFNILEASLSLKQLDGHNSYLS